MTSMASTKAAGMSLFIQSHIRSSCSGDPCSMASTESSMRLRTQPVMPRARAC